MSAGTGDDARWLAAGLLDPSTPDADERRALLGWLTDHGFTVEEMAAAHEAGQLVSLAGDRALRPGPRLTPRQAADRLGTDVGSLHALRRAAGFPRLADDEVGLVESDLAMFELFEQAAAFFDRGEVLRLAAVVGASIRRIADAAGEVFLRDVEAPLKANAGWSEVDLARANRAGVELAHAATSMFGPMFLAHVELSTQRVRAARRDSVDYDTVPLAVGFVDLSGFTERSSTLRPTELRAMVDGFEMVAGGIVGDHGGRVIKLIGDEVMFSAVDATAGCDIAGALLASAPGGTLARGGVTFGEVVASGGDLYGPVVNLASRIADIAVAGEVLVNEAIVRGAAERGFEPAGRRALKGFVEPVRLWSLVV